MRMGFLLVLLLAFLWAWPPLVIKVLAGHFDVLTQNFYRFFSASLFLLFAAYVHDRRHFLKALRSLKQFAVPVALVSVFQTLFVLGIYMTTPTVTAFVSKLDVVFVMFFAFLLFRDERSIIMRREFLVPAALAFLGVIGVVLGKGGSIGFNLGAIVLLAAAVFWGLYVNVVKRTMKAINPLIAVAVIYSLTTIILLALAVFFGDLSAVASAPLEINLLLVFSGVLWVGIANAMNYFAIQDIGTSLVASFLLATPFLTALFSHALLGEAITAMQLASGLVLLLGLGLLIRYRKMFERYVPTGR